MRALGAEARLAGADFDTAKLEAKSFAAATGVPLIEDGLDPAIAEGAGTIALELLRYPEPIDDLLVPLGNGALITGVGRWSKAVAPATQAIGVAATGAPSIVESWRSGRMVSYERINPSSTRELAHHTACCGGTNMGIAQPPYPDRATPYLRLNV